VNERGTYQEDKGLSLIEGLSRGGLTLRAMAFVQVADCFRTPHREKVDGFPDIAL
jgi:hypothetical protein